MKKGILTLAVLASISSMAVIAAEEEAPDMSDPTAVYTTLGFGYGNKGLDLSSMLLLSSTETQKSGIIFDVKNMLNEDDKMTNIANGHEVNNTSYRLRWGTINTQNGLGLTIDAVNLEHPFFGRMTVAQAGSLMTIPIGDDFIMFPIAFVGGVLVEDNTLELADFIMDTAAAKATATAEAMTGYDELIALKAAGEAATLNPNADTAAAYADAQAAMAATGVDPAVLGSTLADMKTEGDEMAATAAPLRQAANMTSDGMSMASTIATGMIYARYAFTDKLWALGSYSYTRAIQGKSWSDGVLEGGLQMPEQMYDITVGYQITPTQNITAFYGSNSDSNSDSDDKWKIGYNYAF
jgi:hypothetical protein